jgi:hypothetical protein
MKAHFFIIILISFCTLSCSENCVIPDEPTPDDGISWEQISGKIAYVKGNILYLLDADSGSVQSLGTTNLTNLKWNKTLSQITGIRFSDDSTYTLEAIDLDGNHSILNSSLISKYYDWLPDGRLVNFSVGGKLLINNEVLIDRIFNPISGLACSPDGNKIVISTDNLIENILLEIDINSLEQRIIERSVNIFEPDFEQPVYSLESDKVLYVTYTVVIRLFDPALHQYRVWSTTKLELGAGKDICRSDNLQRILYTKVDASNARIIGVYSLDIINGDSIELIMEGYSPIWIY